MTERLTNAFESGPTATKTQEELIQLIRCRPHTHQMIEK